MKIDQTDLNILAELQKDSRLSIRELSKKVNLSPPSVNERVKRMEDSGIIESYTIKINKKNLGIGMQCIVKVTLKSGEYELAPPYITEHPRCEACYRMAGDSCFIVVLAISSVDQIEQFIKDISPYATTNTNFVFQELPINSDIRKNFRE